MSRGCRCPGTAGRAVFPPPDPSQDAPLAVASHPHCVLSAAARSPLAKRSAGAYPGTTHGIGNTHRILNAPKRRPRGHRRGTRSPWPGDTRTPGGRRPPDRAACPRARGGRSGEDHHAGRARPRARRPARRSARHDRDPHVQPPGPRGFRGHARTGGLRPAPTAPRRLALRRTLPQVVAFDAYGSQRRLQQHTLARALPRRRTIPLAVLRRSPAGPTPPDARPMPRPRPPPRRGGTAPGRRRAG